MTSKRYGAVIIQREVGVELPAPIVRFLRSIDEKKFRHIYDGETPTPYGRYTGHHESFEETEEHSISNYPEYDIGLDEGGGVHLRRREQTIEQELFGIDYLERTEPPNY